MINKIIVLIFFSLIFNITLKSQITLVNSKNIPKSETRYVYQKVDFDFSNAVHGGSDTVWNFSDIINQVDTISYYFTRNPYYNSFPGYTSPANLDSNYLRSDNGIFKVTDTLFFKSHALITPSSFSGQNPYVGTLQYPILKFPFPFNDIIEIYNSINPGQITKIEWKESDAYGSLVTPDSVYNNLLRIHQYSYIWYDESHSGHGKEVNTYEWYAENSELPLFKVAFSDSSYSDFSPLTHVYDTIAWLFTSKVSIPYNSIEENTCNNKLIIYPSPANDVLNIMSLYPVRNIEIFNMQGIILKTIVEHSLTNTCLIDVKPFDNGLYLMRIQLKDGSIFCRKFLIERE